MSSSLYPVWTETLPEPLPANPMAVAAQWLNEATAKAAQPNPNAMVLATVDARGQPSARVVLCKEIDPLAGFIQFYTNYESRKGRELLDNPRAAVVFHWDASHRQIRAEGRVSPAPAADSDAYFESRAWQSRLGAWASQQSRPVDSRASLVRAVAAAAERFGIAYGGPGTPEPAAVSTAIARPAYWGGFRLTVEAVELWVEGDFRIHDCARWSRTFSESGAGPWTATRLQP